MLIKRVYIAGGMTGYKHEVIAAERAIIRDLFDTLAEDCEIIDPLNGFNIDNHKDYDDHTITTSNKFRIDSCQIVMAMLNSPAPSIGTVSEIVYSKERGKVVIGVAPASWARHPWIMDNLDIVVDSVEEAIEFINAHL